MQKINNTHNNLCNGFKNNRAHSKTVRQDKKHKIRGRDNANRAKTICE